MFGGSTIACLLRIVDHVGERHAEGMRLHLESLCVARFKM
jgi:hypothetical protein